MNTRLSTTYRFASILALIIFAAPVERLPSTPGNEEPLPPADVTPAVSGTPTPVTGDTPSAIDANGYITGVVRGVDTGAPLGSVAVEVYRSDGTYQTSSYTHYATAVYSVSVPAGTYKVHFGAPYASDYAPEWYSRQRDIGNANLVVVTASLATTNINASLLIGGRIAGVVTDAGNGTPLQSVHVRAYTSTMISPYNYAASDYTDGSGGYAIRGLLTGTYYLEFAAPYGSDYLSEFFDDKPTLLIADPIGINVGTVISNINAALMTGGKIGGKVTDATSGTPIQSVFVRAYTSTTSSPYSYVAYDFTDASGLYTLSQLQPGTYFIGFDPPSNTDYVGAYFNNKTSLASADPVSVTYHTVVTDANAALVIGGKIRGRVTAVDNSAPLKNVYVTAYYPDLCGVLVPSAYAYTDASGYYTVTGLLSGTYRIGFDFSGYRDEYYNNKADLASADPIAVAQGAIVSGIDAMLEPEGYGLVRGKISGRVTAAVTGAPLSDVLVKAYNNANYYYYVSSSWTDGSGWYTVSNLISGTYRLEFSPSSWGPSKSYAPEFYDDKPNLASATPINLVAPGVITNINAVLSPGAQITGKITAADNGTALADVYVRIFDANGRYLNSTDTDATGTYTTAGLLSGAYRLQFDTASTYGAAEDYSGEYYDDKPTLATANPIHVTAPNMTGGANAVLARGGRITGRVTAGDTRLPLDDVWVSAFNVDGTEVQYDYTDASGDYALRGLATGIYRVRFYTTTQSINAGCAVSLTVYQGEYYNDKRTPATADQVPVTAPNTVSGINAVLGVGPNLRPRIFMPFVRR